MRAAGVFVGVSKQDDPGIPELNFGDRDARRLHAIFADANVAAGVAPDHLHLLVNCDATCENVRSAMARAGAAVKAGQADLLVIHFSCHGSQQGQLILHDADRDHLDSTSIALHEVATAVAEIPNAQVIITLDCCFSGTVLGQPGSLNREAFEHLMQPLRGEGRFVAWAAGPEEEAYESRSLAHGYLSYALAHEIDAFRASDHRTVPISDWLSRAIAHARDLARAAGRAQTPDGYVRIGHAGMLHVPPIGERQRELDRAGGIIPLAPPFDSLSVYGFTEAEIAAIRARLVPGATLNALQLDAIAPGGLLSDRSLLVRAPTSGGKTLVGELAILRQRRLGRRAVVLLPTRALVHEQAEGWQEAYGRLGLRVVISTGEAVDDDDLFRRNQYDVAVFTYEKFAALLGGQPSVLDAIGLVILDELQMIEDDSRGRTVELLLLQLRRHQRRDGWPQLVVLCAEVEDLSRFGEWLGLTPVGPGARPVPLREGVLSPDGLWRTRHPVTGAEETVQLPGMPEAVAAARDVYYDDAHRAHTAVTAARMMVDAGKQVLLFATTRPGAMRLAKWLAEDLRLAPVRDIVDPLSALAPDHGHLASDRLLWCAQRGVAFHIADLEPKERHLVEAAFRSGQLRVLAATTTMAMGVNSKTDAVIIVDATFYQGPGRPERDLRLSEYRNMCGRAGRLVVGGPREGESYLIARNGVNAEALWRRYLDAQPAGLRSSLDSEPLEDLALALLHIRGEAGLQQLADDIAATFWGYNARQDDQWLPDLRRRLDGALRSLQAGGFVVVTTPPQFGLSPVGRVCAAFGLRSESARRLQQGVARVIRSGEPVDEVALLALAQLTVELQEVMMPPAGGPVAIDWPVGRRGILNDRPETYAAVLDRTGLAPADADRFIADRLHRFAGIVGWLQSTPLRAIERAYARRPGDEPVLARLRGAVDRTADLLAAIIAVIRTIDRAKGDALLQIAPDLRARLEVGGDAGMSRLHRLRLGLSRPECLTLARLGIDGDAALREALRTRRADLEAALSTPGVADLERRLTDPRLTRRRRLGDDQLLLDLVAGLTQV